jgi:Dpy-30 motif
MLEEKRQEVAEIEKHSLPTRHYLMKYIMPNITTGLTEVAKVRPKNAVEFLANFMLSQGDENTGNNPDLDEDVVKEFRKIVKSSKCEK